MLHNNKIKNSIYFLTSSIFIELSRLIKISFMVGSKISFFSAVNIMAPMTGVFLGVKRSLSLFSIHSLCKCLFLGGNIFTLIGYHIPHFFASFYWNSNSKLAKITILLTCFTLFITHPIGFEAKVYTLLWLIPFTLAFIDLKSIFLKALGSTFTAHAVGSVLWIWSIPMDAKSWVSLIPVAFTERILFASGMTLIYFLYVYGRSMAKQKIAKFNFMRTFGKVN